jgi:hypothetical protein
MPVHAQYSPVLIKGTAPFAAAAFGCSQKRRGA